ncbi:uncharacterized protein [Musca autumnalis]|uniref:uncharacterized protein n=1 Tax=Musca autumnalis TaxID=221902 RepID=UPI003CF54E9A
MAVNFEECSTVPENTFIAVENNCRSYIYCAANAEESFQEECPLDTYFDEFIAECVVDEQGICASNKETAEINTEDKEGEEEEQEDTTNKELPENATENKEVTSTITGQTIHSSNRPTCNRLEDSFHPHPVRCEYYYRCMRGYLTIFRCNLLHAWDYEKKMCLPSKEVQCYGDSKIRRF